jgi:probable HAF family extracellular repeat protein
LLLLNRQAIHVGFRRFIGEEVPMKTARWTLGLAGVALMTFALACEQKNSPTAPAHGQWAALSATREGNSSEGAVAADPTFTRIDVPGANFTESNDIGPTGDIVGRYGTSDGKSHGYLLRQGSFMTIDFSPTFTGAVGINPSGDIVGRYQTVDGKFHGFLLSASNFTSLDFPGAAATSAFGINPEGEIVGSYCDPAPCPSPVQSANLGNHGFLLREGTFSSIDFPRAALTQAWKINAAGQIAGRYKSTDGKWHAFLMSDGEFMSIDVPGAVQTVSFPPQVGINGAGDVVSSYCAGVPCPVRVTDNLAAVHGFLRRREGDDEAGQVTTIDFPGASGGGAFGINARGDIVGAYVDASHRVHGFLRSSGPT